MERARRRIVGRMVAWAGALACLTAATGLWAGQMVPLSIEEVTSQSDVIIHGKVLSKSSERDPQGRLFTKVELGVDEVWKGAVTGNRFPVVLAGGTLGKRRVVADGQADYAVGEEVVAFLRLNSRREGVTLGLAQGKFEVWEEQGQKRVKNLFHGRPRGRAGLQGAQKDGIISLVDLRRRVLEGRQ